MPVRKLELEDVDFESVDDLKELKLLEIKYKTQRRISIACLAIVFIIVLLGHLVPISEARIEAMSSVTVTAVLGLLSITGTYVGVSTWMQK